MEPKNGPCCQINTAVLCPVHTWVFLWFCSIHGFITLFLFIFIRKVFSYGSFSHYIFYYMTFTSDDFSLHLMDLLAIIHAAYATTNYLISK